MSKEESLLDFTAHGLLPPGDYTLTLAELRESPLIDGPEGTNSIPGWDMSWRLQLTEISGRRHSWSCVAWRLVQHPFVARAFRLP